MRVRDQAALIGKSKEEILKHTFSSVVLIAFALCISAGASAQSEITLLSPDPIKARLRGGEDISGSLRLTREIGWPILRINLLKPHSPLVRCRMKSKLLFSFALFAGVL